MTSCFAILHTKPLLKRGLLLKGKNLLPVGANSLLLRVDPSPVGTNSLLLRVEIHREQILSF